LLKFSFFREVPLKRKASERKANPMDMKSLAAKANLLQGIADSMAQAKAAGLKDAPRVILKALKAKARLEAFKAKYRTK
jgi:hypothetical protein